MRKFAKTQILEWKFGWKVKLKCTGPQPRIFEGRTGFFEQKLFDKHFMHGIQNPNGHSTLNRRHFDVDITWIRNIRPNFDEFPRHFHVIFWRNFDGRKIHVVSTYFFRCNFDGRKNNVVSTYFVRCNFDGQKIHVVSMYFFWCKFDGRKIHLASTCFFWCNFFHRNIHCVSTYFFRHNFDGQIIDFVCTYFFQRNFDEVDIVVGKL